MFTRKTNHYHLFSIANLIAAFGGGLILGQGISVVQLPWLQGGSILAFFIGTVLGLIFLQSVPTKLSSYMGPLFSICGGFTSIGLSYLYFTYAHNNALMDNIGLLFFIFLSIRFGFWFYSRVIRAANAAGQNQSIAWVECGYYSGMIIGLIIWKLLGFSLHLTTALLLDACLQFLAGALDLCGKTIVQDKNKPLPRVTLYNDIQLQYSQVWCWRLASAVVFITIGIQVVIFNFAHLIDKTLSSYILATFYFGVAIAAFLCNKYKFKLYWDNHNHMANITMEKSQIKFNFLWLLIFASLAVILSIYLFKIELIYSIFFKNSLICLLIFIAAFLFEILSLVLLDQLGYEEKKMQSTGMVMRTYGLMGLGAAISLWLLGLINNYFTSSLMTLLMCLAFVIKTIIKRTSMVALEPSV